MRMPPNRQRPAPHGGRYQASMEGGMRMPPNGGADHGLVGAHLRFNGGRHAHAAE